MAAARKVFDGMPDRNVATWNAMVAGLIQCELNEEGLDWFQRMRRAGFRPDEFTVASVLRGCAGLGVVKHGWQVHGFVIKSGLSSDVAVGSSLGHVYMSCSCVVEGEKVFEELPELNVVACNTIIAGRAQNGSFEAALEQFVRMQADGLRPDEITMVSVVNACSELAMAGHGRQVHGKVVRFGVGSSASVRSGMVSMYSKCGCLDESVKVFAEGSDMDVVVWSAMIGAYGFHGRGKEAILLFERMEGEGMEPTDVTFLGLLYACCHNGLREEGDRFFNLMIEKHGIAPRLEHYTCMVDLLGRCGRLEEAEQLIRTMPVKPDAIIWRTLLFACKIHRNAEMARRVAEDVLGLDPHDSAAYVLLSNIHALDERWVDVSEVRRAMKERNVKKEPGISWLEAKNQVHQFCMGDRTHPEWKEIHEYLSELMAEIRNIGYVPDMGSALHDMEDEEKEQSLAHHSEKLAVAFALMATPEGARIRVMKNLRVCDDCHVAFKYVSKITCREIIVRDASRFHHFVGGECSCGDYW